jgi:hypothetical protein
MRQVCWAPDYPVFLEVYTPEGNEKQAGHLMEQWLETPSVLAGGRL